MKSLLLSTAATPRAGESRHENCDASWRLFFWPKATKYIMGSAMHYKQLVINLDPDMTDDEWNKFIASLSTNKHVIGMGYGEVSFYRAIITDSDGRVVALQG